MNSRVGVKVIILKQLWNYPAVQFITSWMKILKNWQFDYYVYKKEKCKNKNTLPELLLRPVASKYKSELVDPSNLPKKSNTKIQNNKNVQ